MPTVKFQKECPYQSCKFMQGGRNKSWNNEVWNNFEFGFSKNFWLKWIIFGLKFENQLWILFWVERRIKGNTSSTIGMTAAKNVKIKKLHICLNIKMGKKDLYAYVETEFGKILDFKTLIFKRKVFNMIKCSSLSPNLFSNLRLLFFKLNKQVAMSCYQ